MSLSDELTIIIPSKNEEENIGILLDSILEQDYPRVRETSIFLVDNHSTDRTREIALSYQDQLPVEVLDGKLPPSSRNIGARKAESRYLLFIDADVVLVDKGIIHRGLNLMQTKNLHCATTNIVCHCGGWRDCLLYKMSNLAMWGSQFTSPFAVGAFMFFERDRFNELGGFHEQVHFAEDYYLSKRVDRRRFKVIPGKFATDNSRFLKTGYLKMMGMFINTMLHAHDDSYFIRDKKYWD
jgi:glycosyltransferase involved in cell wall biosynthesis